MAQLKPVTVNGMLKDVNDNFGALSTVGSFAGLHQRRTAVAVFEVDEEAGETHNLITNPSFETGTAGWTLLGSAARLATGGLYGTACLDNNDTNTGAYSGAQADIAASAGTTYTLTAYCCYLSGDRQRLLLDFLNSSKTRIAVHTVDSSASVGVWERLAVTQAAPVGTAYVRVWLYSATAATGRSLWDAVQLEARGYPTPYCGGSLGAGHSRTGTAHASASTRAAAPLSYALDVKLPANAIIVGGVVDVVKTFTSENDTATIAISVAQANDIVAAKAIGAEGDVWDAGLQAIVPKSNTPETTGIKLTEEKAITVTVGVEALTAGKLVIYLDYYEGIETAVPEAPGD